MPICRFCCHGGSALGRGRTALVAERDQVPVGMAAEAARLANRFPRDPGAGRRPFLLGIDAGLAVRIAVIALADHAGSRVIRMGSGHRT
jgi:hypothetical protein